MLVKSLHFSELFIEEIQGLSVTLGWKKVTHYFPDSNIRMHMLMCERQDLDKFCDWSYSKYSS